MRADIFLSQNGYIESRTRASRLILEGKVYADGRALCKASEDIPDGEHKVEITHNDIYVGRGGLKLDAAIKRFEINVTGKRCIDIGASTGGFTDCLLQNGARQVYSIDSGRGQLHPKLLWDDRIVNIEGYNARWLSRDELGIFDIAVMDVSFISQTLIHKALSTVLDEGAVFVSLIKPQFESGRSALGKNGIVKSAKDREHAINRVLESAFANGFDLIGLMNSPIEGGDGNHEYLACFVKREESLIKNCIDAKYISAIARN